MRATLFLGWFREQLLSSSTGRGHPQPPGFPLPRAGPRLKGRGHRCYSSSLLRLCLKQPKVSFPLASPKPLPSIEAQGQIYWSSPQRFSFRSQSTDQRVCRPQPPHRGTGDTPWLGYHSCVAASGGCFLPLVPQCHVVPFADKCCSLEADKNTELCS